MKGRDSEKRLLIRVINVKLRHRIMLLTTFRLAECFGCASLTLVKDVDGLYTSDPKGDSGASLIREISAKEIRQRRFETLPFDRVVLDLLDNARLLRSLQLINGHKPELIAAALNGEHVGTVVYKG